MRAKLVTRCGCTREMNVPFMHIGDRYKVPMASKPLVVVGGDIENLKVTYREFEFSEVDGLGNIVLHEVEEA